MKTKNLYYTTVIKRTNSVKMFILGFFLAICSWPRVFIEVFTRKELGSRYMLLPLNLFLAACLAVIPFTRSLYDSSLTGVVGKNITWYAYLVAFVIFSIKRYREIKLKPGVYDFAKYSQSAGIICDWVRLVNIPGINMTNRVISTYIEPAIAIGAGILLALLHQNIGFLLIICGVIYGFSWAAQFNLGDQFIMDKIDETICNEELVNSFVHNRPVSETRGFEVYGEKPRKAEFRRKVAEAMMETEAAVDVI